MSQDHGVSHAPPAWAGFAIIRGCLITGFVLACLWGTKYLATQQMDGSNPHLIRNLGMAIMNYATRNAGRFPPHAAIPQGSDVPLSWRVEILPFLNSNGTYSRWNRSESWDSPANAALAAAENYEFNWLPDSQFTRCVAVTGPQTCWPDEGSMGFESVADDPSQTILIIEYPRNDIPWAEPRDLSLEQALDLYSLPVWTDPNGDGKAKSFHALMADGSVRALPLGLPRETLRALFTATGNEVINLEKILSRDH